MRHTPRSLPDSTSVKEDLKEIYEAIQEVGYAEYNMLKTLEVLGVQISDLQRILAEHNYKVQHNDVSFHADHDRQEAEHRDLETRLLAISNDIQRALDELKRGLEGDYEAEREMILKATPLVLQACKQVLIQYGFDPDTGLQRGEVDRDWKKIKNRGIDILLTAILATIGGWFFQFYKQPVQPNHTVEQQLQETLVELKHQLQKTHSKEKDKK